MGFGLGYDYSMYLISNTGGQRISEWTAFFVTNNAYVAEHRLKISSKWPRRSAQQFSFWSLKLSCEVGTQFSGDFHEPISV